MVILARRVGVVALVLLCASPATHVSAAGSAPKIVVSVADRELALIAGGKVEKRCIRMRSKNVISLYSLVHIGTHVPISQKPLQDFLPPEEPSLLVRAD
jgi:hypothetical protein